MKSTKTFTIDHEIYIAARATGANLSEIVEQALAAHVGVQKEETQPHLFDYFINTDDDTVFLNRMIHKCADRFPGVCKKWSEMILQDYGFKIDYYELHKLCKEMIEDGR